jgi:hypothetical protein
MSRLCDACYDRRGRCGAQTKHLSSCLIFCSPPPQLYDPGKAYEHVFEQDASWRQDSDRGVARPKAEILEEPSAQRSAGVLDMGLEAKAQEIPEAPEANPSADHSMGGAEASLPERERPSAPLQASPGKLKRQGSIKDLSTLAYPIKTAATVLRFLGRFRDARARVRMDARCCPVMRCDARVSVCQMANGESWANPCGLSFEPTTVFPSRPMATWSSRSMQSIRRYVSVSENLCRMLIVCVCVCARAHLCVCA